MIKLKILGIVLFASIISCKKDSITIPTPEVDTSISNTLISGGNATSFQRIIGGEKLDGLYSVKQTNDGGYIFCGFTENEGANERDVLLIRTTSNGETSWIKRFSEGYTDQGWYLDITSDNGFILITTHSLSSATSSPYSYNGQMIKTDGSGNQLWKSSFTFGNYTSSNTVRETGDGGFIVCGAEYNGNNSFILKTDASGNEAWRKTFSGIVEFNQINNTSDGGFIICGSIKTSSSTPSDIYIVRTNTSGDTLWTKTYGDTADNTAKSIKETSSGNFILCGYNTNPGASGYAKLLNANGDLIWHSDFSSLNIQALDYVTITNDNQFIAVGRESFGSTSKAYLQKIDANGNNLWLKQFSPRGYNAFWEVQQTSDNGYVIAGYTFGDAYIVKTDASGN